MLNYGTKEIGNMAKTHKLAKWTESFLLQRTSFSLQREPEHQGKKKSPFSLKTSHPAKITIATCNTCKLPNFHKTNAYIFAFTTIYPSSTCTPSHHHHHQLMCTPYSHMAGSSPGYAHSLLAHNLVILGLCALPTRTQPSQYNYTTLYSSIYVYQHNAATQKSIITTFHNINIFSKACSQGIHFHEKLHKIIQTLCSKQSYSQNNFDRQSTHRYRKIRISGEL